MLDSLTASLAWAEHNILTFLLPAYERPKEFPSCGPKLISSQINVSAFSLIKF